MGKLEADDGLKMIRVVDAGRVLFGIRRLIGPDGKPTWSTMPCELVAPHQLRPLTRFEIGAMRATYLDAPPLDWPGWQEPIAPVSGAKPS